MHFTYSESETLDAIKGDQRRFGYEAVESSKKRKGPKLIVRHEDKELTSQDRRTMTATVQDTVRNFNIVSWMVRKHLDYCTRFSFQAKTQDREFNAALEDFIDEYSRKENCHAARRHPLRRLMRIAEAQRLLSGDFGLLKVSGGAGSFHRGHLQGIESDLIADPTGTDKNPDAIWLNGVRLDRYGGPISYGLHARKTQGGTTFDREVSHRNMILHAYFDSTFRHDQVRGVSAVAAAMNTLRDSHEIMDYAKAREKVANMFGIVTKRSDEERFPGTTGEDTDGDGVEDEFEVKFSENMWLDLGHEDSAEFLTNGTNAQETVAMLRFLMQTCILALDLPISMLDERETTFFGGRGALMQYLKSCGEKIQDVKDVLNEITKWRLGIALVDGEVQLPNGMSFNDIIWDWCPSGTPWWDPSKEVNGYGMALGACFTNFDDIIKEVYGGRHSFEENLTINSKYWAMAKEAEFPLAIPGVAAAKTVTEKPPVDDASDPNEQIIEDDTNVED